MGFTYKSARSAPIVFALGMVIVVETLALHVWLRTHHPWLAWALTTGSVTTLAWLAADYRAMGRGAAQISGDTLALDVGRRFSVVVPRTEIATATRPTWRDLPTTGSATGSDYLSLMKPAQPNVLLTLRTPVAVRIPGGIHRSVRRLGLHLDDPDGFLIALDSPGAPEIANPGTAPGVQPLAE